MICEICSGTGRVLEPPIHAGMPPHLVTCPRCRPMQYFQDCQAIGKTVPQRLWDIAKERTA